MSSNVESRSLKLLYKWRELRRDLLYLKYGNEFMIHDSRRGSFWDGPSEAEKNELALLLAVADGSSLNSDEKRVE